MKYALGISYDCTLTVDKQKKMLYEFKINCGAYLLNNGNACGRASCKWTVAQIRYSKAKIITKDTMPLWLPHAVVALFAKNRFANLSHTT